MEHSLDKDIEILEKKKKSLNLHIDSYYKNDCETAICKELVKERDAISNVLSELETYKKIAEKLADTLSYKMLETLGIKPRIEDLIESYRKEVEKDGR